MRNKIAFSDDPERYIPQYGGFCAYGMSQGRFIPVDLEAYTLKDGKLYFNLDLATKKRFDANPEAFVVRADEQWRAAGCATGN